VVFDDQFATVTANPSECTLAFYKSLYEKASWLHNDRFQGATDLYHFKSTWSAPLLSNNTQPATLPGIYLAILPHLQMTTLPSIT
jgi:hypothetical protein